MDYHLFKKPTKSKNKIIHKWYYYYNDQVSGKMIQKVCKNCKTQTEAFAFISTLPPLFAEKKIVIKDIAKWMYIPGGPHLDRMAKLGKTFDSQTLKGKKLLLNCFVEKFGAKELQNLTVPEVTDFLAEDTHSGSWKNNFLTVVGEVYAEAPFSGLPYIPCPKFPKFKRHSHKKDILSTDELNLLFNESNWQRMSEEMYKNHPQFDEGYKAVYLMFLCCIKCGLRLGEGIGLHVNQFLFAQGMLLVDGFYKHTARIRTNFNKCGSENDKKLRVVPLPNDLALVIQNYISDNNLTSDDYVFYRYGKPIRKCLAEKWFKCALEFVGINTENRILTPHSLRYTYITRMRREAAGETVQKIAGHNSIEMTDYYTRATLPEMVEAAKPAVQAANKLFE